MRIGFDVSQTGRRRTGCGQFARSLVQQLASLDASNEYVLYPAFGTRFWDPDHRRDTCRVDRPNFRRGPEGMSHAECIAFWEDPPADFEARLGHPDVVHANNFFCPPGLPRTRIVYTLYDLVPLDQPEHLTEANRLVCFEGLFRASLRADAIVSISEHTRRRFLDLFPHYPPGRVVTVHPGSRFGASDPDPDPAAAPEGLRPDGFWLYVGTLEPRKNLRRLLRAFARTCATGRADLLVLAGHRGSLEGRRVEALAAELGIGARVRVLGYVPDDALRWLYRHCFAFVYPSLMEGFGLPVLEAMSLGAAVVTSDRSSLPEVTGDAAMATDPEDVDALGAALARLAAEPQLRAALRARALARSAAFSWTEAAGKVLGIYRDVLGWEPWSTPAGAHLLPRPS